MQIALIAFLTGTVLWLTYWVLVRPIILDSVQREYRSMRSELDWNIINGLPSSQSLPAQELSADLAHSDLIRWNSFSQAFWFHFRRRAEIKAALAREGEIFQSSPQWIRAMKGRDEELIMKACLANSPLWWFPIAVLLIGAVFSQSVSIWWSETKIAAKELRTEKLPCPAEI
jgi:hypothetical protein